MENVIFATILLTALSATSYASRYVGCYIDKPKRILEGTFTDGDMTVEKCVQNCSYEGYHYAGVEYANQCFCGNHLKDYKKLPDSACSTKCGGNQKQTCGGTWKISVHTTNNYLGCYVDKHDRILEGPSTTNNKMTTAYCLNFCKNAGKRFALTQYSKQCFCGNHLKSYEKRADKECNYSCDGARSESCGGFWRGSLYLLE